MTHAKARRGFAAMDPETARKISSKGGVAVHDHGTGHEFNRREAQKAGRLGGLATQAKRRAERMKGST